MVFMLGIVQDSKFFFIAEPNISNAGFTNKRNLQKEYKVNHDILDV
jgi:hypothetical protein